MVNIFGLIHLLRKQNDMADSIAYMSHFFTQIFLSLMLHFLNFRNLNFHEHILFKGDCVLCIISQNVRNCTNLAHFLSELSVQKRVNGAGQRLLSPERPACMQGWLLASVWGPGSLEHFHHSLTARVVYCGKLFIQTMWLVLNTCFLSGKPVSPSDFAPSAFYLCWSCFAFFCCSKSKPYLGNAIIKKETS